MPSSLRRVRHGDFTRQRSSITDPMLFGVFVGGCGMVATQEAQAIVALHFNRYGEGGARGS
jgi:hypothetical protein